MKVLYSKINKSSLFSNLYKRNFTFVTAQDYNPEYKKNIES